MYVSAFKPVQCDGGVDRRVQGDGDQLRCHVSVQRAHGLCAGQCLRVRGQGLQLGQRRRHARRPGAIARGADSSATPGRQQRCAKRVAGRSPHAHPSPCVRAPCGLRDQAQHRRSAGCRLRLRAPGSGDRSPACTASDRWCRSRRSPRARQRIRQQRRGRTSIMTPSAILGAAEFGAHALAGILKLEQFGQRCDHREA